MDDIGIGWAVALQPHNQLRITAEGSLTDAVLHSVDGITWTAAEKIRIDGRAFSVSFVAEDDQIQPALTLTGPDGVTYTRQASGGNCGHLRFSFAHHKLCPDSPSRGPGPIANLVAVRLDLVDQR